MRFKHVLLTRKAVSRTQAGGRQETVATFDRVREHAFSTLSLRQRSHGCVRVRNPGSIRFSLITMRSIGSS